MELSHVQGLGEKVCHLTLREDMHHEHFLVLDLLLKEGDTSSDMLSSFGSMIAIRNLYRCIIVAQQQRNLAFFKYPDPDQNVMIRDTSCERADGRDHFSFET